MGVCDEEANEHKANSLWYIGVLLSIVGSIATNMGVNLQKYSFMREAKKVVCLKRHYTRQPLWVIGLLLVIGGSALDFIALGFLPQSLATPVGGSTMVANVAFASLFLKEKFSRRDAVGTTLVLIGIMIVAAFANKEGGCYTVEQLIDLYHESLFIMYIIIVVISCIVVFLATKQLEFRLKTYGASNPKYKKYARLHPVTYPALSGIFGAQSVLFAKSAAELIKTTIEGTNQFVNFGTYAIVLSMFACVFLQIHWLASGLQHFDAVFVVPVFQCFFISVSIFGGGVYFKEFATMSAVRLGMFFLGVCVTLSGVSLLSGRDMNLLRPTGKLRATVKMIIFIKRVQKVRQLEYHWRQTSTDTLIQATDEVNSIKSTASYTLAPLKIAKATVVPIDAPPPHASARVGVTTEDPPLEPNAHEYTPKRIHK